VSNLPATTRSRPRSNSSLKADRSGSLALVAVAIVAGIAGGAITEGLVLRVSHQLEPLTQTAAPWIIVVAVVALLARDIRTAVVLSVITFLALVLGFYLAQETRGWSVSHHQAAFWFAACFVAGPLIGLAVGWLKYGSRVLGGVGAGMVGGIFVGEAIYGLRERSLSTSAAYWHVQIVVGAVLWIGAVLWARPRVTGRIPAIAASLASAAVFALATYLAYRVP
jgi:Family of unknown function (DUF6518)